jgi:hypothetical protein
MTMRNLRLILACLLAVTLNAASGKKEASLEAELNKQFAGKSYSTKIVFGNYIRQDRPGTECYRLIDTEYLSGGAVRYQARKGCTNQVLGIPTANVYVERSQLTSSIPIGSRLTVKKVEVKDDRIEFQLWADPNSREIANYAKLKLFIEGGTKQISAEKVIVAAADVFYIAEYEKLRQLQAEFENLSSTLLKLRGQYDDTSGSPDVRAQAGHALQDTLKKIISNRKLFTAQHENAGSLDTYTSQLAALDRELPALETAAKAERMASIKSRIGANQARCVQLKAQLDRKPAATIEEWQRRSQGVHDYGQLLDERKNLLSQLAQESQPNQEFADALQVESKELGIAADALSADHKRLQLARLNASFQEMKKRKLTLMDKYTRAFGTPQERSSLQVLTSHLQSMAQNRNEAKALGSESAAKEAAQIDAEMEKYKRR